MFSIWQKLHFHARAYHMYVRHCKIVLSMYRYNDFRTVFFLLFFAALYQVFAIAQVIRSLVLCISSLFFHHLFLLLLHLRRLLAAYLIFSQLSWHLCIRPTIESFFFFSVFLLHLVCLLWPLFDYLLLVPGILSCHCSGYKKRHPSKCYKHPFIFTIQ